MSYRLEVAEGPDKGIGCRLINAQVIIGRDANSSDLLLSDITVSRRHAMITKYTDGVFHLEDLGSTGGTFVNGTLISEVVSVGPNDLIKAGSSILRLVYAHDPASASTGSAATASISIGRDPSNDLFIENSEVSRQHALIEKRSEKYYLTDLESINGTFLDGNRISGTVELKPSQWINISGNDFFFDGVNLQDAQGIVAVSFRTGAYQSDEELPINKTLMIPFGKHERAKWIIGSILVIFPILSFFGEGYRYRLMQNSINSLIDMPEWDNWGDLFIKGLLFFLIRFLYMILPLFVLFVFLLIALNLAHLTPVVLFLLLTPGLLFSLFASLLIPMGWARFAATGQFKEAFNFFAIIQSIKIVFRQYLLITLYIVASWIIIAMISQIPLLGLIIALLGSFYIFIFSAFQYGDLYRRSELFLQ
jgi:pSer/pThr/pTyr-binding forkhead associated (FHA) protein